MKKFMGVSAMFCICLIFLISGIAISAESGKDKPKQGTYHLVGVGPGDADLLTSRALNVIRAADIVFCNARTKEQLSSHINFDEKQVLEGYERLFPFYKKDCANLTEEEKKPEQMSCEEYHKKQAEFASLVRQAVNSGKNVVMLSGGDPTIYGPSVWTLKELENIKPVVIPGLSSFNAATALLQVSLGEVIITAPFKKNDRKDSIESLAVHDRATMVIFMPRDIKQLLARLSSVLSADTPLAVVSYAGCKDKETVVTGTIGDIEKKLDGVDIRMSLIYVGKELANAHYRTEPQKKSSKGKYYLVGIGPGDPDLATLRALNVIEKSDLIFASTKISEKFAAYLKDKKVVEGYHRLFPFYKKDCAKLTDAEKARERMSCEEYHKKQEECAAMVRQAVSEGKTVSMLDNGDPLIYGPCSWSLAELSDIDTEVVPGLSAFNAANAALCTGVTEGKNNNSVILASGWSVDEMSIHGATMVLFTMRTEFKKFIEALSKHYSPQTPVAIVFSAGYMEKEKVVRSTLGTIIGQVGEEKLPFEYLLYVGDSI